MTETARSLPGGACFTAGSVLLLFLLADEWEPGWELDVDVDVDEDAALDIGLLFGRRGSVY